MIGKNNNSRVARDVYFIDNDSVAAGAENHRIHRGEGRSRPITISNEMHMQANFRKYFSPAPSCQIWQLKSRDVSMTLLTIPLSQP